MYRCMVTSAKEWILQGIYEVSHVSELSNKYVHVEYIISNQGIFTVSYVSTHMLLGGVIIPRQGINYTANQAKNCAPFEIYADTRTLSVGIITRCFQLSHVSCFTSLAACSRRSSVCSHKIVYMPIRVCKCLQVPGSYISCETGNINQLETFEQRIQTLTIGVLACVSNKMLAYFLLYDLISFMWVLADKTPIESTKR